VLFMSMRPRVFLENRKEAFSANEPGLFMPLQSKQLRGVRAVDKAFPFPARKARYFSERTERSRQGRPLSFGSGLPFAAMAVTSHFKGAASTGRGEHCRAGGCPQVQSDRVLTAHGGRQHDALGERPARRACRMAWIALARYATQQEVIEAV